MEYLRCECCANKGFLCGGCKEHNTSHFKWDVYEELKRGIQRCSVCKNRAGYPNSYPCTRCNEVMSSKFEKDDEKEEQLRRMLDESESKREMSIMEKIHKFVLWGSIPALCIFIAVFEIVR